MPRIIGVPLYSGDTSVSPSVSSQTNDASKLGAGKHWEMAVSEVPLIANGLATLKLARERQSATATTNVTLYIATVNTW